MKEIVASKTSGEENFPVGSWLLPGALRPYVAAFYNFARSADDISDTNTLSSEEKLAGLQAMDMALDGLGIEDAVTSPAFLLHRILPETKVDIIHCHDLLKAFMRDSVRGRCYNWDDLLDYCRYSAAPVGRFLLDLHGEDKAVVYGPGDALCAALQILNHLQDCGKDYKEIDRVYIPDDWLAAEGLDVSVLGLTSSSVELRRILDKILDGTRDLLVISKPLASLVNNRGLRMEVATIQNLAERLLYLLYKGDPLASKVKLSKLDFLVQTVSGIIKGFYK